MTTLLSRVQAALLETGLLGRDCRALVAAVSGGPDSLALLTLLRTLSDRYHFGLHAAHLNHGLRGTEGDGDALFVGDMCRKLDVPLVSERADIESYQKRYRLSVEAAAREARYTFLARVAANVGASAVATGHTADDQAETVLLHIIRGAGLRGLRGMLRVSEWCSRSGGHRVAIVRPLLGVTRQETEAHCAGEGISPRYDSSNAELRFARNRVRHVIVPLLREHNPAVTQALGRLASSVAEDVAYLDGRVEAVWPSIVDRDGDTIHMNRPAFRDLHRSLQAQVLQRAFRELAGHTSELGYDQIRDMLRLASSGAGRRLDLGSGLEFHTGFTFLTMITGPPVPSWPHLGLHSIPKEGQAEVQGWRIRLRVAARDETECIALGSDRFRSYLDAAVVGERLGVRSRRPGDRFQPLGMRAPKKLKDFLIDGHVPQYERDGIPLLVSERGIAWVVGYSIAEWAKVTPETQRLLEVAFARNE